VEGRSKADWIWYRERIAEAQRAKPFFYGDFYPLTAGDFSAESWLAYHLYLPEKKAGLILAYRRPKSDVSAMSFDLKTIDPDASYEFEDVDSGTSTVISGAQLRKDGYTIKTAAPREARMIYYRRK